MQTDPAYRAQVSAHLAAGQKKHQRKIKRAKERALARAALVLTTPAIAPPQPEIHIIEAAAALPASTPMPPPAPRRWWQVWRLFF